MPLEVGARVARRMAPPVHRQPVRQRRRPDPPYVASPRSAGHAPRRRVPQAVARRIVHVGRDPRPVGERHAQLVPGKPFTSSGNRLGDQHRCMRNRSAPVGMRFVRFTYIPSPYSRHSAAMASDDSANPIIPNHSARRPSVLFVSLSMRRPMRPRAVTHSRMRERQTDYDKPVLRLRRA